MSTLAAVPADGQSSWHAQKPITFHSLRHRFATDPPEPADVKGRLRAAFDRRAYLLPLHPALFAQHQTAFEAIRDERYENFMLYPRYVDGVATSAIVVLQEIGNAIAVSPLVIAPTDGVNIYGRGG